MLPKNRVSTHPGEILLEEFLKPLGITQVAFSAHLGIPLQRVNEIIKGHRGVTPETAWLFAEALGTSAELWLGLQMGHDLTSCQHKRRRHVRPLRMQARRARQAAPA